MPLRYVWEVAAVVAMQAAVKRCQIEHHTASVQLNIAVCRASFKLALLVSISTRLPTPPPSFDPSAPRPGARAPSPCFDWSSPLPARNVESQLASPASAEDVTREAGEDGSLFSTIFRT